ncbi:MAG TPA: prolyl oligopeptidase family serine peptidase [Isosphaeraceae bacterium]|nr:prolyl oligopeptidase family serine peptidase [Isosphaeraceae bacterium]
MPEQHDDAEAPVLTGRGGAKKSGGSILPLLIGIPCGLLVIGAVVGLCLYFGSGPSPAGLAAGESDDEVASADSASDLGLAPGLTASAPAAAFPALGQSTELEPGVLFYEIKLGEPGRAALPGKSGKLWLYLPDGDHAARSLACVLITGAGSILVTGMDLGDGDRPEHLPYVRAGFAVLAYEMDGALHGEMNALNPALKQSIEAFVAAEAGLANARIALDFLGAKVPQVDPNRIAAVGHSSAGTAALLVAEYESRIKACVAFAPRADIETNFPPAQKQAILMIAPRGRELFTRYNPIYHRDKLRCPVFLFHAEDDSNVPIGLTRAFAAKLESDGRQVTFVTVTFGNHYDSMIKQGIPRAIEWLQQISL